MTLWGRQWARPQALMWEQNGQAEEVALYVRTFAAAERPRASANLRTLVKQQQEALGISLPGLLRLRWRIAGEPARAEQRPTGTDGPSPRSRFHVVRDGE